MGTRHIQGIVLLVIASGPPLRLSAQEREPADTEKLTETEQIRHLLSRFAFGPTRDQVEEVRRMGMDEWFEQQFGSQLADPPILVQHLADLPSIGLDIGELIAAYQPILPRDASARQRREASARRNKPRFENRDAVLYRAIYSTRQVQEVAADFFRNHFNVSDNKNQLRTIVPDWERTVIRDCVFASFGEMLERSAKHPAMLIYLDNALSRRALSKAELRAIGNRTRLRTGSKERAEESIEIARQRGLNENYARELLELHTLGVDNYYKQRDVIEVAKALTGWTTQLRGPDAGFRFRPDMHSRGEKILLGGVIKPNRKNPVAEGMEVLRRLTRHRGTSKFIAWKLCRYFMNDTPSEAAVRRVAAAFRKAKGDLPSVYRAIYEDPEFFAPQNYQAKFKRPFEFVVSALRVTGAEVSSTKYLHATLTALSEPIYQCEDPTGYYDQAEAWRDPGVMAVRWNFAMALGKGKIPGVRIPRSFYDGLHPEIPRAWKDQLAALILPAGLSAHTRTVLDDMVHEYLEETENPRPRELGGLIVGLLIGSPEFQRQ